MKTKYITTGEVADIEQTEEIWKTLFIKKSAALLLTCDMKTMKCKFEVNISDGVNESFDNIADAANRFNEA